MATDGLRDNFFGGRQPHAGDGLDTFLQDIPTVMQQDKTIKGLAGSKHTLGNIIEGVVEAIRKLDSTYHSIAYSGSQIVEVARQYPDVIAGLPVEQQAQVAEIMGRMLLGRHDEG